MLVSIKDIGRKASAGRPGRLRALPESLVVPSAVIQACSQQGLPDDLVDEALGAWLSKAKSAISQVARKIARRFRGKQAKPAPKALPEPKLQQKVTPKPSRVAPVVRQKGLPGGIPKRVPAVLPSPVKPERTPQASLSKPVVPVMSPADLAAARKAAEKNMMAWPANWDTTAPGAPVSKPEGARPAHIQRALGPKGKPGKFKPAVSHSAMYQHMVRAIYVGGKARGYAFKQEPGISSQKIARAMMIKWGYAKRATGANGKLDRRRIQLTGKGFKRSLGRHAKEPPAVQKAKSVDYDYIVRRGPL